LRPTKDTTEFSRIWSELKKSQPVNWYENHRVGRGAEKLMTALYQQFSPNRTRRILSMIPKLSDILELGCGLTGRIVYDRDGKPDPVYQPETYDQTHSIGSWRGIDAPEILINARVRSANICNSGEPTESCDAVVLNRVLKGGKFDAVILAESYRLLRPSGALVGAFPLPHVNRQNEWNSGLPDERVSKDLKQLMKDTGFVKCHTPLGRTKGERSRSEDIYFHGRKP
jgi:SAM-dependent methyltransferase